MTVCPFGYAVVHGVGDCPSGDDLRNCLCIRELVMYALGDLDDQMRTVVEFWRQHNGPYPWLGPRETVL